MFLIFKNIIKKVLSQKLFSILFILGLTLSIFSFIWINILNESINNHINVYKKDILGGDLTLKNYQPWGQEDREIEKLFPKNFKKSSTTFLIGMVSFKDQSKLSSIRFIDQNYPLYGNIYLNTENQKNIPLSPTIRKKLENSKTAFIDKKLALYLNLNIGDTVTIGNIHLKITHIIEKGLKLNIGRDASLPRLYVHKKYFEESQLFSPSSRIVFSKFYQFDNNFNTTPLKNKISELIDKNYKDKKIFTQTAKEYAQNSLIALKYISDYLMLIALTSLFLSGISAFYLFNSHIQSSLKEIAVYLVFSPQKTYSYIHIFLELIFLCLLSFSFAMILYFSSYYATIPFLKEILPVNFKFQLSLKAIISIFSISIINPLLFCSIPLYKVMSLKTINVLKNNINQVSIKKSISFILIALPIITYYFFYIFVSKSIKTASIFFFILCFAVLITYLTGYFLLFILKKINNNHSLFPLSYIIKNITRNKTHTLNIFLSLSLITTVIGFIPQAQDSIQKQIQNPNTQLPSLFLFDIKKKDIPTLQNITKNNNTEIKNISPMLLGKLIRINDTPLDDWDIKKASIDRVKRLFKNRAVNFTYHNNTTSSEKIIKGEPLQKLMSPFNFNSSIAEISITKEVSEMLNLTINDELLFNVEGIDIKSKIKNIRTVKWNEFKPNFFIVFQEGIFENFPQTYVSYIPKINNLKDRIELQKKITSKIKAISILDVEEVIKESMENIEIIYLLSVIMVSFMIICGFIIFLSIIIEQLTKRRKEVSLLKILSPHHQKIKTIVIGEFLIISTFSCFVGTILSFIINILTFYFLFEDSWTFSPMILSMIFLSSLIINYLISWFTTYKTLKEKPVTLLKENL